jgi:bile acid:Na+ symporter, BASS family
MLLTILETGVPAVAFLLMIAVGLDVSRADLRRVAGDVRLVGLATLMQAALIPAVALALAPLLPSRALAGYLLLLAACPGGGMSNVYVYLARANTALSVTLTAASCLAAIVTMPVIFGAYELLTEQPLEFALPLPALLAQLLIMAVIPVALGAWIRNRRPELERRYGRRLRVLTAAGVIAIVGIGIVQSAGALRADLFAGGAAAAALAVAGMAGGWILGAWLELPEGDRFALLVEFGVRNLAIAMVIAVTFLHQPDFVAFGALALFGQAALLGVATVRHSRAPAHRLAPPAE